MQDRPDQLKPVLVIQTYHVSSHHIRAWLECQEYNIDCLLLINDEESVCEEISSSSSLPREMKNFLRPLHGSDSVSLGLPLIPFRSGKIKNVNYYCGDYGFYIAHTLYKDCNDIFFVKVDHDVMIYGDSWPAFLETVDTSNKNFITLQCNRGPYLDWHWHPSSQKAYGEDYYFSLFGLQGLPGQLRP